MILEVIGKILICFIILDIFIIDIIHWLTERLLFKRKDKGRENIA